MSASATERQAFTHDLRTRHLRMRFNSGELTLGVLREFVAAAIDLQDEANVSVRVDDFTVVVQAEDRVHDRMVSES